MLLGLNLGRSALGIYDDSGAEKENPCVVTTTQGQSERY
jgi:hypothetical protein